MTFYQAFLLLQTKGNKPCIAQHDFMSSASQPLLDSILFSQDRLQFFTECVSLQTRHMQFRRCPGNSIFFFIIIAKCTGQESILLILLVVIILTHNMNMCKPFCHFQTFASSSFYPFYFYILVSLRSPCLSFPGLHHGDAAIKMFLKPEKNTRFFRWLFIRIVNDLLNESLSNISECIH